MNKRLVVIMQLNSNTVTWRDYRLQKDQEFKNTKIKLKWKIKKSKKIN